jgi:hypothetical protein
MKLKRKRTEWAAISNSRDKLSAFDVHNCAYKNKIVLKGRRYVEIRRET